jgi:hypothetical protein
MHNVRDNKAGLSLLHMVAMAEEEEGLVVEGLVAVSDET